MTKTDLQVYSKTDLENARTKGQLVGLLQGAGAILAAGLVIKIIGWIPAILVIGAGAYLLYRVLKK